MNNFLKITAVFITLGFLQQTTAQNDETFLLYWSEIVLDAVYTVKGGGHIMKIIKPVENVNFSIQAQDLRGKVISDSNINCYLLTPEEYEEFRLAGEVLVDTSNYRVLTLGVCPAERIFREQTDITIEIYPMNQKIYLVLDNKELVGDRKVRVFLIRAIVTGRG